MEDYLKNYHKEEITDLLNSDDDDAVHVSIKINLTHLYQTNRQLFEKLYRDPHEEYLKWNKILLEVQKSLVEGNMFLEEGYLIKENCHVRFINLPDLDGRSDIIFPTNDHIGKFLQIKGNVVRMTQTRLVEVKKEYGCNKCKNKFTIVAEYSKMYVMEPPKQCPSVNSENCKGVLYALSTQPKSEYCIDYQELRIQELLSDKNIPSSMMITLENDLTDCCQPGDCITVCGTIERRWKPLHQTKKSEVVIVMRTVSVSREETRPQIGRDLPEQILYARAQWQETIYRIGELEARDLILKSICPDVHGMFLAKLAVALSLCSGVERANNANSRGHSHLLLVGDPGLAKSKLIKAASKIAFRAVYTTGMGCSQAGLTAAAVKDGGEWVLEAGALVLADGGICCIDEFNLMRETDKASIHEAMEQQTVSMAKAGIVCKLTTRCAVLAATNHKNLSSSYFDENSSVEIGIASPLMSRFDIVLILRDARNPEWDERVVDHVLGQNGINQYVDKLLTLEDLQSHFLMIRNIHPEMTKRANEVLACYYKYCRADPMRDPGRTSVRLLDSLIRLAQSHARLMFRSKVTLRDAIIVIKLIESSWGFGRLIEPYDILETPLPLGPNTDEICGIMNLLNLDFDPNDDGGEVEPEPASRHDFPSEIDKITRSSPPNNLENCYIVKNDLPSEILKSPSNNRLFNEDSGQEENLDEILSLDDFASALPVRKIPNKKRHCPEKENTPNRVNIKPTTKRSPIEENFQFKPKKKIKSRTKSPVNVDVSPLDQINLDSIIGGIRQDLRTIIRSSEQIAPQLEPVHLQPEPKTQTAKNLMLSTQMDIDLDEIFGSDNDDNVCNNSPAKSKISTKTLSKLQQFANPAEDNSVHAARTLSCCDKDDETVVITQENIRQIILDEHDDDLDCLNFDF